jgi:hypothetical protein
MVRHYETAEEAYATRHELWHERQDRERERRSQQATAQTAVPLVDRYMFDLQGFFVVKVERLVSVSLSSSNCIHRIGAG